MVINIISLNTRGLRNNVKRRSIFNFYRPKCDILCIQETHSTHEDEDIWKAEWGGRAFFAHGTNNSRGVAILVKRSCRDKISLGEVDTEGRVISVIINHCDENLCVMNIYGPNHDAPGFYEKHIRQAQLSSDKLIVIGDYNTVLDPEKDRKGVQDVNYHKKSREKIQELIDELHLCDIWRTMNPEATRYSWYRILHNPTYRIQASRIDYALVSMNISSRIHNAFYLNGLESDHSAYFVGVDITGVERGKGYWKMNTSYLYDGEFVQTINDHITDIQHELQQLSALERWEVFKLKVKEKIQQYTKAHASEEKLIISQLSERITELEDSLETLDKPQLQILENTKIDHAELVHKQSLGVMFRSRAKWALEGERNTKYFLNLERTRYGEKTCYALFQNNGQITQNPREIQQMQEEYFGELYEADSRVSFSLPEMVENPVSAESSAASEEMFSENEIAKAVKDLKNSSCPGNDGLPIEFYKVFWTRIKTMFIDMINESYQENTLADSLRSGVLNLIPKGQKDTRHLKNLRPITLLNSDYKIIERLISNRMVPSLQEIIHPNQTGFLPNRRICANIRKLLDVVYESIAADQENLILSCDFMKCFDRIETECIIKGMKMFKFSEMLIHWVKIIYTNFSIKVQNNGQFSHKINVTRSVRQGGPASNAIFIVVAELLAIMLREDQEIHGVFLHDILHFLNQFADDLDICTRFDQNCLNNILQKFTQFEQSTGFKLSYEKTTVYRTGSLRHSLAKLYTEKNLNWTNEKINVLGVHVMNDQNLCTEINYNEVMKKMESVLSSWAHRNISLCGKIQVINSLTASLFVYKMQVLPTIPEETVKKAEHLMEKYLWNGHRPKIPLSILQSAEEEGGLKLVNLRQKDCSLKCLWIKMLLSGQYSEELVYRILETAPIKSMIWCCNLQPEDVPLMFKTKNAFWTDVMKAWCTFHFCEEDDRKDDEIIWYNSRIRVQGKPIAWMHIADKLMFVSELIQDGEYIDSDQAHAKFDLSVMEFNSIKSAIPNRIKQRVSKLEVQCPFTDEKFRRYNAALQPSRYVYWDTNPISPQISVKLEKLEDDICMPVDITELMRNLKKLTVVQKLRSFQYRQLMSAIVTNVQLFRWKLRDNNLCTNCQQEAETIHHLFYACPKAQMIWAAAKNFVQDTMNIEISTTYGNIMLCEVAKPGGHIANLVCLVAKQYIYRQRCKKETITVLGFKHEIIMTKNIEKYYAIKESKYKKFCQRWCIPGDVETISQMDV